jgi:ribosomal protein S18 acetylase RimI-like enzyme
VLAFLGAARRDLRYRAFVAELEDGRVIGSAGCQLFAGLYPDILEPAQRRYGYIWGVYVEPDQRRGGIGRRLTEAATAYLTSIGCTHALLHAAPSGHSVYAGLGFEPTNEMRLPLTGTRP